MYIKNNPEFLVKGLIKYIISWFARIQATRKVMVMWAVCSSLIVSNLLRIRDVSLA